MIKNVAVRHGIRYTLTDKIKSWGYENERQTIHFLYWIVPDDRLCNRR